MICANEKCRKAFLPKKPWAKYHSFECAEAVRHRRYYQRRKRRLAFAKRKTRRNKKVKA